MSASFRDYATPQANRLLEFRYIQFAFQAGVDELLRFSGQLFRRIVREGMTGDWLPAKRRKALEAIRFPLPEYDFAEFQQAANAADGELTFENELAALRRLGNTPAIVRNYTPRAKPNVPDLRRTQVNRQVRLLSFSILVPGLGSLFDGGEIESKPEVLARNFRESVFYDALAKRGAVKEVENYISLFKGVRRKKLAIGGLGLERTLQYLVGVPSIDSVVAFPTSSIGIASHEA
jgi:aspartyl/asparaginyl-tRNA synthetase